MRAKIMNGFLVVITGFVLLLLAQQKKSFHNVLRDLALCKLENIDLKNKIDTLQVEKIALFANQCREAGITSKGVIGNLSLIDENGKAVCIEDLNHPTLIFYYGKNLCLSCYHSEFENVRAFNKKQGADKVVILTNFDREREVKILKTSQDH